MDASLNCHVVTTRTGVCVDSLLQRAGQAVGVKYSENPSLLRGIQYRLELNKSKNSKFHVPDYV